MEWPRQEGRTLPETQDWLKAGFHVKQSIVTVVDLPLPPSTNRIWQRNKAGKKLVSRSPAYKRWIEQADKTVLATAAYRGVKRIVGPFNAVVRLSRAKLGEIGGDPDNRIKALLDYAQSRSFIENDRHLEVLWVQKANAETCPYGVRLTLMNVQQDAVTEILAYLRSPPSVPDPTPP
jgi:Holliday junction resolvase RusA-like endonuclease